MFLKGAGGIECSIYYLIKPDYYLVDHLKELIVIIHLHQFEYHAPEG